MHFYPDQVEAFLSIFEQSKPAISCFPGCLSVELLQDASDSSVYYTYSQWIDADALEYYRQSFFFKETWAKTKILFASKAQAFSLKKM
jgi:quinol monooxygenase YgiN